MSDNIWIVILLVIVIIGGSNLLMLGMVKGTKNIKYGILKDLSKGANPWKKEDQSFEELNNKVENLQK